MDFFNTLSEIHKNKDNFKKWEEEQKDEAAKREELKKRRQHNEAEIAKAKALGAKIIDVIDIMDNHSESVAENVETATQPIIAIAPLLSAGLSTLGAWKFIIKPAGKHVKETLDNIKKEYSTDELLEKINKSNSDKIKDEIFKEHNADELVEKLNNSQPQNRLFKETYTKDSLLDVLKIKYIQDPELKKKAKEIQRKYNKTYKQLDSLDLFYGKDIAKKINDPELKKKALEVHNKFQKEWVPAWRKMKLGGIGIVASTIASFIGINIYAAKLQVDSSKIARFQAREFLKDPKTFVMYTPEQIQAAKDEIEQNPAWKKKKMKDEPSTGMVSSIINLFKDRKAYKKFVENDKDESKLVTRKLTPEEIENAKKDKEVIQRTVRIINNQAEKYSTDMEVASDVIIGTTPFLGMAVGGATGWLLNKFGVIEKYLNRKVEKNGSDETKKLYNELKEAQKKGKGTSMKWGRFMESFVRDVKTEEKGIFGIIDRFGRFSQSLLATKKGSNYILGIIGGITTGVAGALIGLQLQKNASRAGRYTAKCELEKDPTNFIGYSDKDYDEVKDVKASQKSSSKVKETIMFIPNVLKQYFAYKNYRENEYKEDKLLLETLKEQKVSDKQLKDAKNLQRKLFNTFEKVDDNSQTYSEATEAAIDIAQPFVYYGGWMAFLSPFVAIGVQVARGKITPASIVDKATSLISSSSKFLKSGIFKKYISSIGENISRRVKDTDVKYTPLATILKDVNLKNDSVTDIVSKSFKNLDNLQADFAKMSNEEQCEILNQLESSLYGLIKDKVGNEKLADKIQTLFIKLRVSTKDRQLRADAMDIILNASSNKIGNEQRVNEAYKFLEECNIKNGTIQTVSFIKNLPQNLETLANLGSMSGIIDKNMVNQIQNSIKSDIPSMIKNIKDIVSKIDDNTFDILAQNFNLQGMKRSEVLEMISKIERFTNKPDPKALLGTLKDKISKMENDDFAELAEKWHFKSMTKDKMLEILPRIEKIMDNIPKEELTKIWDIAVKEFNENPDEFIKFMQSADVKTILKTPFLDNALLAAQVSWGAFMFTATYAISQYLGEIQLEAGRLGVMKAMEDLDDYRYYADIEPSIQQKKSVPVQTIQPKIETNLLKRLAG